jgi:16S rRNA (uracil1498-N3)-methyltransferase
LIHGVMTLTQWFKVPTPPEPAARLRLLLSLRAGSLGAREAVASHTRLAPLAHACEIIFLSGPEGGLSPAEEDTALTTGFAPVTLGPRVLRAETAALFALAAILA